MSRYLPPLTALRALEAAGRHVNFSRAAEELHVTPGAISRQIRYLEFRLGLQLFNRSKSQITLTENSAIYVKALTDAFNRIEIATERLVTEKRHRQLKIACSTTFALRWLVPRLPRFYAANPGVELTLTMAPHPQEVAQVPDVDMAIVISNLRRSEMVSERLFSNQLIAVCNPRLLNELIGLKPEALVKHKLLLSVLRPTDWATWFEAMGVENVKLANTAEFANSSIVYKAAQTGLGFAVARLPLVLDDLLGGSLVPVFPTVLEDRIPYCMIYSKVADSPNLKLLKKWIRVESKQYLADFKEYTREMKHLKLPEV